MLRRVDALGALRDQPLPRPAAPQDASGSSNAVRIPITSDGRPARLWRLSRALLVSALPSTLHSCLLAVLAVLATLALLVHVRADGAEARRSKAGLAASAGSGWCPTPGAALDAVCFVWRSRLLLGALLAHLALCAFGPWCVAELMEGELAWVYPDHVVHADGAVARTGDPLVYGAVHAAIILPTALLALSLSGAWRLSATEQRAPLVKGKSAFAQVVPRLLLGWALPAAVTLYAALALAVFEVYQYMMPYGAWSVLIAPGAAWGAIAFSGLAVLECGRAAVAECRHVWAREGRVA